MSDLLSSETSTDKTETQNASRLKKVTTWLFAFVPGLRRILVTDLLLVAVKGSLWTGAGYGASQLLKMASTLVLARLLLDPKAFGVMALVNVFLSGLEVLSDLGIGLDIVQHPRGEDHSFLDTAFAFQMVRSVLLCLVAIGLAVPLASLYHQPEVRWLAIGGSMSLGIRGFANMSIWLMTRRVQVMKLTTVNVIGDATGLATSIIWALLSPTAWALVAGKIATSIAYVVASHIGSDWMPSLRWEREAARDILMFGSAVFWSSVTYFFSSESERLVVGKFASMAELGCFSLALSMSYAPFGIMQRITSNVFFPMISNTVREDKARAAIHFRKCRVAFLAVSLSMALGFITLSHSIVRLALRPQYAATAWMLQLLGFRSSLELFGSAAGAMLFAVGVPRYAAIGNTLKLSFLAVGLTIAFSHFGLRQAMWVLTLSPLMHYAAVLWGLQKRVRSVIRTELTCFAGFVVSVAVILIVYCLTRSR